MDAPTKIQLNGKDGIVGYTTVSPEDFEWLNKHKWYRSCDYVQTNISGRGVRMSRLIMSRMLGKDVPPDLQVEHKNIDPLDNSRENLRLATHAQNSLNRRKRKNTTSAFYGVSFNKQYAQFESYTTIDGKRAHFGYYDAEEDAAKAYDIAVIDAPDVAFRPRNFPHMSEEELRASFALKNKRVKMSRFRGVAWRRNVAVASILVNGTAHFLLRSQDEEECARAYDAYVVLHRLNRPLNFPEEHPGFSPDRPVKTGKEDVDENTVRLADADDYDKVKCYSTCVHAAGYVLIRVGRKSLGLHRYIMNVTDPAIEVDHISGDRYDNRKANLRYSDNRQNARNKRKRAGCSSQYIGVCKTPNGTFRASMKKEDYSSITKTFEIEEDAARWRDLYYKTHMPHAHFNFNFDWSSAEDVAFWRNKLGL
jgi:hypothetical protein